MARRKTVGKFAHSSPFSSSSASASSSSVSSAAFSTRTCVNMCEICGERAIGCNFGCQTCMSCKAFFRRHARNEKEKLKCPFVGQCPIDQVTRKFCASCRLKKCFAQGMKKDNILTEEQRAKMREKIAQNRLLREQQRSSTNSDSPTRKRKRKSSVVSNSSSNSNGSNSSSSTAKSFNSKQVEDNSIVVVEYLLKQQQQQQAQELLEFEDAQADPCNVSVLGPDNYFPSLLAKSEFDDLYIGGCGGGGGDYPEWPMDPFLDQYCNELLGEGEEEEEELFKEESSPFSPFSSEHYLTKAKEHSTSEQVTESSTTTPSPAPQSSPETSSPETESTDDYLLSYLNSPSSDYLEPLNPFHLFHQSFPTTTRDPVIESVNPAVDRQAVYTEIGFSPLQELLRPEKCLLQELTTACSVLQNSYTRLETGLLMGELAEQGEQGEQAELVGTRASHLSACLFGRLEQMANRLAAFRRLSAEDRQRMLQGQSLLEMAAIRSVLLYDEYRDAWCVFDDKEKTSVFLRLDSFAPFCTANSIERHKAFPRLFFDEWKRDTTIFDLITAVLLFTPRPEYRAGAGAEIEGVCERYRHLLRRYLAVKYASAEEAERTYAKLQANLEEMRTLSPDVQNFFQSSSNFNSAKEQYSCGSSSSSSSSAMYGGLLSDHGDDDDAAAADCF